MIAYGYFFKTHRNIDFINFQRRFTLLKKSIVSSVNPRIELSISLFPMNLCGYYLLIVPTEYTSIF